MALSEMQVKLSKLEDIFVETCYDGTKVFKMLQGKKVDESVTLMDGDIKMWEITKRYDRASFPATVASLGYAIDVFSRINW